jgi:hypothetical protein
MIALADPQEAPERHHGIGDLAGNLVDHKIVHRAELLALAITHCGSDDFVGGDQTVRSSVAIGRSAMVVVEVCIVTLRCISITKRTTAKI